MSKALCRNEWGHLERRTHWNEGVSEEGEFWSGRGHPEKARQLKGGWGTL